MQSRRLKWRVDLEHGTVASDTFGGETTVWAPIVRNLPAEKTVSPRDERVEAAREEVFAPVTFRIRWRADVTEKDRLIHEGKVYDITSVTELGFREGLELVASLTE